MSDPPVSDSPSGDPPHRALLLLAQLVVDEQRRENRSVGPAAELVARRLTFVEDLRDFEAPRPPLVEAGSHFDPGALLHGRDGNRHVTRTGSAFPLGGE